MERIALVITCLFLLSLALLLQRVWKIGRNQSIRKNVDYETLEEGDLIVVSAPGYHHVAIFKSKSECGTHFTADLFDFDQDISVRDKVLTRLQFRGKV